MHCTGCPLSGKAPFGSVCQLACHFCSNTFHTTQTKTRQRRESTLVASTYSAHRHASPPITSAFCADVPAHSDTLEPRNSIPAEELFLLKAENNKFWKTTSCHHAPAQKSPNIMRLTKPNFWKIWLAVFCAHSIRICEAKLTGGNC